MRSIRGDADIPVSCFGATPYRVQVTIVKASNATIQYYQHNDAPYMGGWPFTLNYTVPTALLRVSTDCTLTVQGWDQNGVDSGAAGGVSETISISGG